VASNRVPGHRDIHPDDTKARQVFAEQMRMVRKATNVASDALINKEGNSDWTVRSIKEWADSYHLRLKFTFEGFDHVRGFSPFIDGDTATFATDSPLLAVAMKCKVIDLMVLLRISGAEMDRRLNQRKTFQTWRNRATLDVHVSTIQRMVRALGGQLKITLEHRYNDGVTKRINSRSGS
jgi:hypothetical protein